MSGGKGVLLFGGSFDPPHAGHMNLLQNAITAVHPGEVLVIPAGTAPHKNGSATPWDVRAAMCECFRPLFPTLVVSDVEQRRGGKSYTHDTVCQLRAEYPGADLYLCVGGDMLRSFSAWHRWDELLHMVTLVAMARSGGEEEEMRLAAARLRAAGGRVLFAPGPVVETSSTAIRKAVQSGAPDALRDVPPPADTIVRRQGLYGSPGS